MVLTDESRRTFRAEDLESPRTPWDWVGVLGTGQSLSVGECGMPVRSTVQRFNNLKLDTGVLSWPVDPRDPSLRTVPLTEPVGRTASDYPSAWPENIAGETLHTTMASQVTAMTRAMFDEDHVGVHSAVGENGQGIRYLKKDAARDGINGRAFEASEIEVSALVRLAAEAGKSYGIGAIVVTHGETDADNGLYGEQLVQLWKDYNEALSRLTGQAKPIQMIVSQQNSVNDFAASSSAQWRIPLDIPEGIVCSGPKYVYPYAPDGVHLSTEGYRRLGEKTGQVYFERVVCGRPWQPLMPLSARRDSDGILVRFHVPFGPLVFDESLPRPHADSPERREGRGFEVRMRRDGQAVRIRDTRIEGDSVRILFDAEDEEPVDVAYAMTAPTGEPFRWTENTKERIGTYRWGCLRDSDPFVGLETGAAQPNRCVAFEIMIK